VVDFELGRRKHAWVVTLAMASIACSHDWDLFDPRLSDNAAAGPGPSGSGAGGPTSASGGSGGGGNGVGAGGSGGGPGVLDDSGLLARYYLDEADSGTAPTEALDAAPRPLALPIEYVMALSYTTDGNHRGLNWTTAGDDGGPRIPIIDTKILELSGSMTGTIEAVARIDQAISTGSRLVHTGLDSSWHFSLAARSALDIDIPVVAQFELTTDVGNPSVSYPIDFTVGRVVLHAVLDTSLPTQDERMKLYLNGVLVDPAVDPVPVYPTPNEVIAFVGDEAFALGNRLINDRSIEGTLFYGAYYTVAFSAEQVANNVAVLTANDDTP
jgi:hypothetical protein